MPRRVTPLDSSSGMTAASSAASASEGTAWPGVRRNTVHRVYSVSPATGVVTASPKAGAADDSEVDVSVPVGLLVMPSIILQSGWGSCQLAEKPASLLPRLGNHGGQTSSRNRLPDGDDPLGDGVGAGARRPFDA